MYFTTLWSKMTAISIQKNWFTAIWSKKNCFAAIWREKKVDPCYFERKKGISQLFGARKKRMTAISSQKH